MKKGFTLIELLAVIVILAIIALIATPIVLSIISDSKGTSGLRSAEMYLNALENSIATSNLNNNKVKNGNYSILENGNICLEYNENKCINELKVEVNGEVPNSGTITYINGKIYVLEITYKNGSITKNEQGELKYIEPICTLASDSTLTGTEIGAKYTCKVDPEKDEYTFYVISVKNDGTINLIMDQNINSDGSYPVSGVTKKGDNVYDLLSWNSSTINAIGPTTTIRFLYNATKSWINVPPINFIYNDNEGHDEQSGYRSIVFSNGLATITPLYGDITIIGTEQEPLRARLPIYSSDATKTEVSHKSKNSFLYLNLNNPPYGYWTLSSNGTDKAYAIYTPNTVGAFGVNTHNRRGVRPVITLSKSYIEN